MKKAFTLIELLIVVIIMGVVYTLAVNSFQDLKDGKIKINLKNLKQYMQNIKHKDSVELICLDGCSTCRVYVDGELHEDVSSFNEFLNDSVEVYRYDFLLGFVEQSKKIYFNKRNVEKDVCFSLHVDKKAVSDQIVVVFKDKVYDFTSYFDDVNVYSSLDELSDKKAKEVQEILE